MKKPSTFVDLPTELRQHIWDQAIWNRECLPAAHFFNASRAAIICQSDRSNDSFTPDWSSAWCSVRSSCWDPSEPEKFAWASEENISGYLQNSGFWNACAESRQAVLRHWKKHDPDTRANATHAFENCKVPDDTGDCYLVTRPPHDLFCINLAHLRYLMNDSFCYLDRRAFQNLGFDFDPAWVEEFESRWVDDGYYDKESACFKIIFREKYKTTLDDMLQSMERFEKRHGTIWLIDYRLQPTTKLRLDKVAEGGQNRAVFRAQDRRFVAVVPEDIKPFATDADSHWWTVTGDCEEMMADLASSRDIFAFKGYLADYLDELACTFASGPGTSVHVLGCVMDED